MKKILYASALALTLGLSSCSKDFLETSPTDRVDAGTLLTTVQGAQVAMDGVYRMLYSSGWTTANTSQNFGIMSTKVYTSLMGEDFLQDAQGSGWFYFDYKYDVRSRFSSTSFRSYATWNFYYTLISNANYILGAESTITGDANAIKNVMAQAYAMRAYAYFQLIQGFQQTYVGHQTSPGVPVYTEPTRSTSKGNPRGTVEDVYTQINKDLDISIKYFEDAKIGQRHKSNIDAYVASAIKANVALVQNQWAVAETYATKALDKPASGLISGDDLYSGFNNIKLKNVLWGAEIIAAQSSIWASFFSHMDASAGQYAESSRKAIYSWLYNQIPATDARKKWWHDATDGGTPATKPYNQVKFRYSDKATSLGDYVFLRAEEMQLVKAEAQVQQEKYAEAKVTIGDLMKLRNPTGYEAILNNMSASKALTMGSIGTPTTLMDQIILQRRIELWGESERIYDILRLKTGFDRKAAGSNHSFAPTWNTLDPANKEMILTIPQKEFDGNTSLDATKDQNPI
ncbi:RagB/SusD family nutrient uptake outer membrane protein [Sphingobacterium sp. MYb382]|uniref:RagB/SusD family nutrient uptake outer membrane protein n=1 Tax=Sphingobacterium sp. MYb382 TaxID=2745278 RepID=UPI003096D0EB